MANDSVGVAAAASPTNYVDNESISTGGSPATVDRQRVRVGGSGYTDLADVVTGDTGQGAQIVAGARKEVSFSRTTAGVAASTDVSNYRFVSVHVTSRGTSSTNTFQVSNDNVNWVDYYLDRGDIGVATSTANGTNFVFSGPLNARYFRINVTGISSGSTAGVVEFFSTPPDQPIQHVTVDYLGPGFQIQATGGGVLSDASSDGSTTLLPVKSVVYNGASWDRRRVPAKFFTATATASGDTAVWTPTSGKKFRLMRYKIEATIDVATSGGVGIDVLLRDSTTALGGGALSFYAPATSVTTTPGVLTTGWVDLGNGQLSAAANNVLNVNLSATLSSGKVRVVACGTEE